MHKIRPKYNDFLDFEVPKTQRHSKPKSQKARRIILANLIILLVIGLVNIGVYFYINYYKENQDADTQNLNDEANSPLSPEVKGLETCQNPVDSQLQKSLYWWDGNYQFARPITLRQKESFDKNKSVFFEFDHQNLVQSEKSNADGSDVRIVGRKDNQFIDIPFKISNTNNINTLLNFEFVDDYEFFMYYGNTEASSQSRNNISESNEVQTFESVLANEITYPINVTLNRKWALIKYPESNLILDVQIEPSLQINLPIVNYEVLKTDEGSTILAENNKYSTIVNTDDLSPGEYEIQATLTDDCFTIKSPKVKFNLSYPLFISWTMDWEGYSTNQSNINQIEDLAVRYNIPLTQFFNPRIYITSSIPQENKNLMTNYMKDRQSKGDEIGLHLHMWKDMVRQAGVTPKDRPQWDTMNTGYDVIFSAYNTEESDKIIKWSLESLKANGFNNVTSFRSGGWEISPANFAALEANGIKLDSSGRTFHRHGTQLIASVWKLTPTTKPYLPSKSDLNTGGGDYFNVWEFPNNGADSYIYSYDQMMDRFNQNYSGGIMNEPQTITYLSHPHWFNTDYPKLNRLFGNFEQYKFEKDQGPLVYTTLDNARIYWESLD